MIRMGGNKRSANDGSQKAKNRKATLKRLWFYLSFYKKRLIFGLILTIIANVLALVGPYLIGQMIGAMNIDASEGINFEFIYQLAILLVIFYVSSAVLNYFLSIAMVKIAQSVVYKLRTDLFNKLTRISVQYFDDNQTGDIISRMSYDIDSISTTLAADAMSLVRAVITLSVSFVMMIFTSPILVLAFIITIPISFIVTALLSRVIKRRLRLRNQQLGLMNGYAEEMISAQKTIQSYVQEDSVYSRFNKHNQEAAERSYEAGYYSTMVGPSVNFINNLGMVLIGTAGAILRVYQVISIADLASFMLYSRRFSGPINQMSNLIADIQSALAAAERVFYVLDQPEETQDIIGAKTEGITEGHITFDDVSFGYREKQIVLDKVSFKAKPGQTVAIVGETGAGKTTLVNLLMRFYDVRSGKIFLDQIPISDYQRKYYRKSYSMVLQDTWLFKGTVYENIKYGNGDVSEDDVIRAAKNARIHHYISRLPQGYQTILSDDGINISKGQKQLIVIARAMLSDSQLLILDEATSNVDTYTEMNIQEAMKKLMENKTCFIIAHRLSTIQNADLILLMKNGNIIEQGNHHQLMEQKGNYYQLFMSQFS